VTPRPRTPHGGGDGTTTRPHGGDGDGTTGRPSQRHGNIDAGQSVSNAHQAITESAHNGRPHSTGNGSGTSTAGRDGIDPETTTPSVDGETSDRSSSRPEWLRDLEEGNEFNRRREPYYEDQGGANEVHVEPRTDRGQYRRVDSYVPNSEIVSRKHTQLSEIAESTGIGYLREFVNHYDRGTIIADTPTNRRDLGDDQIGQPLVGDLVLEVPAQRGEVPRAILEEAERLDIIIRDENGRTYELPD
jgi:hypothetical protein